MLSSMRMGSLRFFRALRLLGNAILLHLCVTSRADTQIIVWGDNSAGQLDLPNDLTNVVAIAAGELHSLALLADGRVVAWGYNYYGQCTVPIGLEGVVGIAAGEYHSVAVKADGTVEAWGAGSFNVGTDPYHGQSIVPPGLTNVAAVAACGHNSGVLRADGTVVAWGSNTSGQTNVPTDLAYVSAIAMGFRHCAVLVGSGPPF